MVASRRIDIKRAVVAVCVIGRADAAFNHFTSLSLIMRPAYRSETVINRKDPVDKRHRDAVF
jgi:hypothetical protein